MQGVLQNENPLAATDSLKIGGPLSPPLMQPISPSSQVNDIVGVGGTDVVESSADEVYDRDPDAEVGNLTGKRIKT